VVTLVEIVEALVEHLETLVVADDVTVIEVRTYAELGILSQDPGVVLRLSDGRGVALKVTDYHRY
jgi:hypothetical protein